MPGAREREAEQQDAAESSAPARTLAPATAAPMSAGPAGGGPMTPARVMALQRAAGNAAVSQMLHPAAPLLQRDPPPGGTQTPAPPAAAPQQGAGSANAAGRTRISPHSSVQDAKNSVRDAMDRIKGNQVHAISALERTSEIKDPPPPPDIIGEIILSLVTGAASAALGGLAGTIASGITFRVAYYSRSSTAEDLFYNNASTAKAINDFLKAQLQAGATAAYTRLNGPAAGPLGASPQIAFFQRSKTLVEAEGEDRKTEFNNRAAAYDQMPADQALNELQVLKEAMDLAADNEANNSQSHIYLHTLTRFANLVAQLKNGTRTGNQHAPGEGDAANLSGSGTQGILTLNVRMDRLDGRPTINSATLDGIPAELRAILAGKTIGELGMNVRVNGVVGEMGPERTGAAFHASRNSGGTVDFGPREAGTGRHFGPLNFFAHKAEPSDPRWVWGRASFTGGGSYGIFVGDERLEYHEMDLWEDAEDRLRQRQIDDTFAHFRQIGWTGARIFIEQDINPLPLPASVGGRAS